MKDTATGMLLQLYHTRTYIVNAHLRLQEMLAPIGRSVHQWFEPMLPEMNKLETLIATNGHV
jgi:hypothetical protein